MKTVSGEDLTYKKYMKYVDIKGEQEIQSISITLPSPSEDYTYYYPDGIKFGIFKRKLYFISSGEEYYEKIKNALKENEFEKEGKIWVYGEVRVVLRSRPEEEHILKYKDLPELNTYLEILETRWGVNMNDLVCLESPNIDSLYEHKNLGFRST